MCPIQLTRYCSKKVKTRLKYLNYTANQPSILHIPRGKPSSHAREALAIQQLASFACNLVFHKKKARASASPL